MIAVALPDVARALDHPPGTVTQALVTGYLVAAVVLQSPGGKLGDRIGHWRMFALGQLLIAAGAVLGAVAPVLVLLALARILIAAGRGGARSGDRGLDANRAASGPPRPGLRRVRL